VHRVQHLAAVQRTASEEPALLAVESALATASGHLAAAGSQPKRSQIPRSRLIRMVLFVAGVYVVVTVAGAAIVWNLASGDHPGRGV